MFCFHRSSLWAIRLYVSSPASVSMQMGPTERRATYGTERKMNGSGAGTTKKRTELGRRLSTAGSVKDPLGCDSSNDGAQNCSNQVTLHDA